MVCYLDRGNMKKNAKLIAAGIIILAMLLFIKSGLFAISGSIPPFPVANLETVNSCPANQGYATAGSPYINQSIGYCYPITYQPTLTSSCSFIPFYGYGDMSGGQTFIACVPANYANQTEINNAINFNNNQIQSAIDFINMNVAFYDNNCNGQPVSSLGIPPLNYSNWQNYIYTCVPSTSQQGMNANQAYMAQRMINLLQQTNSYIQSHVITTTTTVTTTSTTSTSTTTIVTSQAPPTMAPPVSSVSNFFSAVSSSVQSFLLSVFSNFKAWFSLPSSIFSVGISGANFTTATNTTYVNKTITISIAIALNNAQLTVPWVSGASFVQDTFCGSFVYYNNTKTFIYESNLINMTTANYNNTINFKPTQIGVYVAGVSCQTTNATFSNGAWSAWSTPKVILLQQKPFAVIPQTVSITPPTTSITITNTSFFSSITAAIQSFINSIITFFKSL